MTREERVNNIGREKREDVGLLAERLVAERLPAKRGLQLFVVF